MSLIDEEFNKTSICEIISEHAHGSSEILLKRIADIDDDGKVQNVKMLKDVAPRKILVQREQEGQIARLGVWNWKAMSNAKKVLFKARYRPEIKFTLVSIVKGINASNTLSSKLIAGQIPKLKDQVRDNNGNLLVLYKYLNDFSGYFIKDTQLQERKYCIKENIFELQKFSISRKKLLDEVGNFSGYQLLKRVDFQLSNDENAELVKSTNEIIKSLLLEYLDKLSNNSELTNMDDTLELKRLIQEVPQQNFLTILSDKLKVSESTAKETFEKFVQEANKYIEAKDIPSSTIYRIVNQNPEFQAKAMTVYEKFWRRQNTEEVRQATKHLSKLKREIESDTDVKQIIELEIESSNQQMNELKGEIQSNQELVKTIEARTNEKLFKIQNDAIDYLTNAPFVKYLVGEKNTVIQQYTSGIKLKGSIEISSEAELLKTIEGNLYNLGIEKVEQLAKFFYASVLGNISLLLVGPYSEELADLLSMSVYGRHAAVLDCMGEFDLNTLDKLEQSDDKLIIVRNIFNSKWVNYIPRLVNLVDKQVIFTHPFIEDLRIEPESLYNYMLPIFTELFIDHPERIDLTFVGGNLSANFEEVYKGDIDFSSEFMQQNCSRRFVNVQMNNLLKLYHAYSKTRTRFELDYLCCYAPYAYLNDKQEELKKFYQNKGNLSVKVRKRLDEFLK